MKTTLFSLLMLIVVLAARPAMADLRVRDVCRVKGQEENVLQGLGLVVGLNGTGDGDAPTTRALAQMMQQMGVTIGRGPKGEPLYDELENTRNVALAFVTVRVPAEGAREGDRLDCSVSAVSAKSLEGGSLLLTPLLGPHPGSSRIYGFAQGPLVLGSSGPATKGKITRGCRLEEELPNTFHKGNQFTLVLHEQLADFRTVDHVQWSINKELQMIMQGRMPGSMTEPRGGPQTRVPRSDMEDRFESEDYSFARAVDPRNIVILIPEEYQAAPVSFISLVMDIRLSTLPEKARVTIDEKTGTIVIGENVEVRPLAISHKNITISTNGAPMDAGFIPVTPGGAASAKLSDLIDALNAIKVPPQDRVDIIKTLHRSGDLLGELVVE